MQQFFYIAIFIMLSFAAKAQDEAYDPETFIPWSNHNKLNWDLYKGTTGNNSFGDASTSVKIQALPYVHQGKIYYQVYALFNKERSWYKETSKELLAHEQLHFDIAELTARMIRKKVAELKKTNTRDFNLYNDAIQEIFNLSNAMDEAYDAETLHGVIGKEQKRWEAKVKAELHILRNYEANETIPNL